MVTTEGMLEAYYDCRRSKRRTASAIVYEMNYESNLIALRDRINTRITINNKHIKLEKNNEKDRTYFRALHGKQPVVGSERALGRVQG